MKTKVGRRTDERFRCYDCQYPPCDSCGQRPLHAIMHNAMHEGKYFCYACKCPPCQVCHAPRKSHTKAGRMLEPYTCMSCSKHRDEQKKEKPQVDMPHTTCANCGKAKPTNTPAWRSQWGAYYCSESCKFPVCGVGGCQKPQPRSTNNRYTYAKMPVWHWPNHEEWKA